MWVEDAGVVRYDFLVVDPEGPACHTGARGCFVDGPTSDAGRLDELARVVAARAKDAPA